MSDKTPSSREYQILKLIHSHYTQYNEPPSNEWLAQELFRFFYPDRIFREGTGISQWESKELKAVQKNAVTILGRLAKNGYVDRKDKRPRLTAKALQYFTELYNSAPDIRSFEVLPTQIKLNGKVRAGRRSEYDLEVDVSGENDDSIVLPNVRPNRKTYALQVEGNSMENEGIFEGDYVIIEEFNPSEWPRDGDMIVTKYLELPEYMLNDQSIDLTDFEMSGHTLKIYKEVIEKNKKYYRLSWKRDHQSNPHLIKAVRLSPVGRVIGVYRLVSR